MHTHDMGQFTYAESGLLTLVTDRGSWLVPKGHLVWIPKDVPHQSSATMGASGWVVVAPSQFDALLPASVCVIEAPKFLLALFEKIVDDRDIDEGALQTLLQLAYRETQGVRATPLGIALPTTPRLREVALALIAAPASRKSLEEWAADAAMSERTFSRRFKEETGSSFGSWKRRALTYKASELLALGQSVSRVSAELGYESISAFIHMFKKEHGRAPGALHADSANPRSPPI
jgi:AraC-like DNA-binding protein